MLRSCRYCGRIHDSRIDCEKKRNRVVRIDPAAAFRRSNAWRKKSQSVMERDRCLCQLCIRGYLGTIRRYNSVGLSVHHNIPIVEDMDRALDDSNLITLCEYHHQRAEAGAIPRDEIQSVIDEQNAEYTPPGGAV